MKYIVKSMLQSLIVLVAFMGLSIAGQVVSESVIDRGRQEFIDTCALCHGEDATGNGPLASSLSVPPPNLTYILKRNEGEFPFLDLYFIIDGQKLISAHGSRKMPAWGKRYRSELEFSSQSEFGSQTYATGKIMELILYLHSIQQ